ncbi:alpha/beta hydrolase [Lederbergia galactosidilytica]|uniref:Esterase n=1 Tax=Lederbergia galactosidilytica TaxID=217031 RepID=A0A177ZKH4_9BACI|nr:alpha/beta hydrolase [Lederbergia galactosidilytica]OAK68477.1 esterase [Lederbergia galactosidilytica]
MREPKFDFPVIEKTFKRIGTREVKLYIFEPVIEKKNKAVILFFIGGTFKQNPQSPAVFQHQANYFASLGMVAICVDYRAGHDEGFTPKHAIADAKSAVRWVRKYADELGSDREKVIMCGSSAGGYVCVSSIMFDHLNDEPHYSQTRDHIPNALIIFGAGMDGIDIMQRRYPQLLDQASEISPFHNIKKALPSTLWMCGTKEDTPSIPNGLYEQNKLFVKQMVDAGNEIVFEEYEGMEHGFFKYEKHENKYFQQTNERMAEFLKGMGFVN